MLTTKDWNYGDRVLHAKRPEWGAGLVTAAVKDVQDGRPCQRLTIRFDRAGIKTISTALADLEAAPEGYEPPLSAATGGGADQDSEWLAKLSGTSVQDRLNKLPDACTDPFTTGAARLKATLDLYRFTDSGGSLLDWAAAQSGMKDPMSKFNRHELEVLFQKFAFTRDEHLKKLVLEMKKKEPAELAALARAAPAGAQQLLRRLDAGR